jgi:hypothetical protein
MKYFLITLVISVLCLSCEPITVENSVPNKEEFTTIQMQEFPKDTVIVSFNENKIYFFNEKAKVYLQAEVATSTSTCLETMELTLFVLIGIIMGIGIGIYISN